MTLYKPELVTGDKVPMSVTNPRHLVPETGRYSASGEALSLLGDKVGSDAVTGSGGFENAMLKALDSVNSQQNESSTLTQQMITDPDSVDPHDVTIAMAKANLSLNITRVVMDRVVRGWKEIINSR